MFILHCISILLNLRIITYSWVTRNSSRYYQQTIIINVLVFIIHLNLCLLALTNIIARFSHRKQGPKTGPCYTIKPPQNKQSPLALLAHMIAALTVVLRPSSKTP